jgi:hypothetical protein
MTTGWKLDQSQREALLERFPPLYPDVIADHVTLLPNSKGGAKADPPAPVVSARIVGRACDNAGVEAMVVEIDGSLDRPDGGTWHITWSLSEGRTANESNAVIAELGFVPLDGGEVSLAPARW